MGSFAVRILHADGRVTDRANTATLLEAVEVATITRPQRDRDIVAVVHADRGLVWAKGYGSVWQEPPANRHTRHGARA